MLIALGKHPKVVNKKRRQNMKKEKVNAENQQENSNVPTHLQPFAFKKGQSGNPKGRPAGKSLKEYTREMLAAMDEQERQEFLHGIPKESIWKMAEGNFESKSDITSKGEQIVFMPLELMEKHNIKNDKQD